MRIFVIVLFTFLDAIPGFCQCLASEQGYKDYYTNNSSYLDPIEGIWSANATTKVYDDSNTLHYTDYKPQVAKWYILSDGEKFRACSLDPDQTYSGIKFSSTAKPGLYLYENRLPKSNAIAKANAIIAASGFLEYTYEIPTEEVKYKMGDKYISGTRMTLEITMIKLYPSSQDIKKHSSSSGTGFAISSNGSIVTNYHVIEEATTIYVRGVNGDFSKKLKAKLEVVDKNNDLAIIGIDDLEFRSIGSIPYIIPTKSSEVGTSVFCLGYPLRSTMGDEVKLTNGIISSKSGFQGDISAYQISAPVQPGNSGGPLFDDKGNLVGIINAKHVGAENVSYAVKASYLLTLIDNMTQSPILQTSSILSGKSLPEQVKIIRNITYIIETE